MAFSSVRTGDVSLKAKHTGGLCPSSSHDFLIQWLELSYFLQEFLSSLRGMAQATSKALDVFRDNGVELIVESKARP